MGQLINGKAIAEKIEQKTAEKVIALNKSGIKTKLAVVLVGDDKPSQTYVGNKEKSAKRVGIEFDLHKFPADIPKNDLIAEVKKIQEDKNLTGLIVQLPLPEPLFTTDVLNAINPKIDVDCLTDVNLGKLVMKTNFLTPPTPGAVMSILKELNIDLIGKNVVIIGTGALVGKPLAIMMTNESASVITINSKTGGVKEKCLSADIIITGVGKKNILRGDMIKDGVVIIDTGVSFENGEMSGDVNVDEVLERASFVTPTPGGVGPITVARLLWNTALCAEKMIETGK